MMNGTRKWPCTSSVSRFHTCVFVRVNKASNRCTRLDSAAHTIQHGETKTCDWTCTLKRWRENKFTISACVPEISPHKLIFFFLIFYYPSHKHRRLRLFPKWCPTTNAWLLFDVVCPSTCPSILCRICLPWQRIQLYGRKMWLVISFEWKLLPGKIRSDGLCNTTWFERKLLFKNEWRKPFRTKCYQKCTVTL